MKLNVKMKAIVKTIDATLKEFETQIKFYKVSPIKFVNPTLEGVEEYLLKMEKLLMVAATRGAAEKHGLENTLEAITLYIMELIGDLLLEVN